MLPGIICTIKIGKLCRCYCLSRGINACILIFSAAGSCWIPSGWFSHPPGTPVTASAHTEICKTFFSWCQHHYSGKVRTFIELPVLLNATLSPAEYQHTRKEMELWLCKMQHSFWLEHTLLSVSPGPWSRDLLLQNVLMIRYNLKGPVSPYTPGVHLACRALQPNLCV